MIYQDHSLALYTPVYDQLSSVVSGNLLSSKTPPYIGYIYINLVTVDDKNYTDFPFDFL